MLSAQLTYGTTGLLHMPSAEMQKGGTVMLGGNFLNKSITPSFWSYNTFNYFLNVTLFPWLEVAYTMTLMRGTSVHLPTKSFTNQDRYFSVRIRAIREGQFWKYMPAVVLGTSDPYSEVSGGEIGSSEGGNGFFSLFYIAATKHFQIGKEDIGVHVAYLTNRRRNKDRIRGLAAGLTYDPSFLPGFRLIAEYDTKDFAIGATYLLFNHLHLQCELQRMQKFTGGLAYKIYLK